MCRQAFLLGCEKLVDHGRFGGSPKFGGFLVNPPPSSRYHKNCCRYIKALLTPH